MDSPATFARSGVPTMPLAARDPGDAALDVWLRQSLRAVYDVTEPVPDFLLRLCEAGPASR